MSKFLASVVVVGGLALASPSYAAPSLLKIVGKAAVAPVVHPKRSLKEVVGSVLFAAEPVVDVASLTLQGLDKVSSVELKHNPFHYAAVVAQKADVSIEVAEDYLFGSHN